VTKSYYRVPQVVGTFKSFKTN